MKKIKKLSQLSQAHGKDETSPKLKPTTLDQIWGDDGTGKYSTLDEEAYKTQLDGLNRTDLHVHAAKLGVIPVDNRSLLEQRLMREFKKHVNSYQVPAQPKKQINLSKEISDILGEGR